MRHANRDTEQLQHVIAYTDGACLGNPGPGGYGVVLLYGQARKELSGAFELTTNNRMEFYAVVTALSALKRPYRVTLYSDSRYLIDAVELGWLARWRSRNWRTAKKTPVRNVDLWEALLPLLEEHEVSFKWVQGHAGVCENEVCDRLATRAAASGPHATDEGYLPEDETSPDHPELFCSEPAHQVRLSTAAQQHSSTAAQHA